MGLCLVAWKRYDSAFHGAWSGELLMAEHRFSPWRCRRIEINPMRGKWTHQIGQLQGLSVLARVPWSLRKGLIAQGGRSTAKNRAKIDADSSAVTLLIRSKVAVTGSQVSGRQGGECWRRCGEEAK